MFTCLACAPGCVPLAQENDGGSNDEDVSDVEVPTRFRLEIPAVSAYETRGRDSVVVPQGVDIVVLRVDHASERRARKQLALYPRIYTLPSTRGYIPCRKGCVANGNVTNVSNK